MSKKETKLEEINAEEMAVAKPYTLRSLKDRDLFPILDILSTALPDDLSDIFSQIVTGEKSVNEVGGIAVYKIVIAVLKNVSNMPEKIYPLLSDLSGVPAAEIPDMPFGTTPGMIWDVVKDVKNASFFKELSKLL